MSIKSHNVGYTVIELLVVLAALGLLLSITAPRMSHHVDRARDIALRQNLVTMRDALDKFRADHQRSPGSLAELVQSGYLREIPVDPITDRSDSWRIIPNREGDGIQDVHSGALTGGGPDGRPYASW